MKECQGIASKAGVAAGQPCIEGTGIPAEAVADRFTAGEPISELMADYDLESEQVEAALRYVMTPPEWTQEAPNNVGLYWIHEDEDVPVRVCTVGYDESGYAVQFGGGEWMPVDEFDGCWWLPCPIPEGPPR